MKIFLKIIKKLHSILLPSASHFGRSDKMYPNKPYAGNLIERAILSGRPLMVARLGATEMSCMVNYLGVKYPKKYRSIFDFVSNRSPAWWWNGSIISQMQSNAGFFSPKIPQIEHFCELMIGDLKNVDILGSWLKEESFFRAELQNAKKVTIEDLEPFFTTNPWTRALKGKKVLVVHPFADTIKRQYLHREKLFDNELLPQFDLQVIQAVQTIAGQKSEFSGWFEALDSMKQKINKRDFDICIIGCGAYGFPLASFVKNMGKQAIHLGGATQLLFGIKGKRWEQILYYPYENLMNEYWVRPATNETPRNSSDIEGACYW